MRRQHEPQDEESVDPVVPIVGERAGAYHAADANDSERQQIAIGMQNDVRSADRVKLLLWDGTGLVLVAKRLEKNSFRWPQISDGVMRLTSSQLSALLEGLDWIRVRAVRVPVPQATL